MRNRKPVIMHGDFLQDESSGGLQGLLCKLQEPLGRGTKKVPLGFKEEVSLKRGFPESLHLWRQNSEVPVSPNTVDCTANTTEFLKVHQRLG